MPDLGTEESCFPGASMRTQLMVACLLFGPALAGCGFQRKPPYARDPDLLIHRPVLSNSAEVMSERSARRKPTAPPKPQVPSDNVVESIPKVIAAPTKVVEANRTPVSPYGGVASKDKATPNPDEPPRSANRSDEQKRVERLPAVSPPPDTLPLPREATGDKKIKPPPEKDDPATDEPSKQSKVEKPPEESAAPKSPAGKSPIELPSADSEREPEKKLKLPNRIESPDEPKKSAGARVVPPYEIVIEDPSIAKRSTKSGEVPTKGASVRNENEAAVKLPALSKSAPPKSPPKTIPGHYGRDEGYNWLQGIVEKNFRGDYSLRYCDPSVEDQFGGKVRLEDDPRLSEFKHGDVIAVVGQVDPEEMNPPGDTWHYPRFRIKSVVRVESK